MSKEDIEKAVQDAERFASEDKARREEVDLRNEADQIVYQSEKMLSENKDKFDAADASDIEAAVMSLRESLQGEDINLIKSRKEELQQKFYAVSEKLYQAQAQQGGGEGGFPGGDFEGSEDNYGPAEDDIPQA